MRDYELYPHKPLPPLPSAGGTASGSWLDQATSLFTTIVEKPFHEVEELIRKGPGARARSPEPRFASAETHTVSSDGSRSQSSPEPRQTRIDSVRASDAPVTAESHLQGRTRSSEPQRGLPPNLHIQIPIRRRASVVDGQGLLNRDLKYQPPSPQSCPASPCLRLPHYDNFMGSPKSVTFSQGANPAIARPARQLAGNLRAANLRALALSPAVRSPRPAEELSGSQHSAQRLLPPPSHPDSFSEPRTLPERYPEPRRVPTPNSAASRAPSEVQAAQRARPFPEPKRADPSATPEPKRAERARQQLHYFAL
ncbi:hypothetical protein T484DRAFT_1901811 [Baffinella frigidus]|nr:hypothetical protein T484DRAFT_1901811 [Cryptophyta sp. CCMP2293]